MFFHVRVHAHVFGNCMSTVTKKKIWQHDSGMDDMGFNSLVTGCNKNMYINWHEFVVQVKWDFPISVRIFVKEQLKHMENKAQPRKKLFEADFFSDGIDLWLSCAHGAPIDVSSIALVLRFL